MKTIEINHVVDETCTDGGGALLVTAHTPEAKLRVLNHFNEESKLAECWLSPEPLGLLRTGSEDRRYYCCRGTLDKEFTSPYYDRLQTMTGRDMRGETIDAAVLTGFYPREGLLHTHYVMGVSVSEGALSYDFVIAAQEWNKRAASVNAERYAMDYAQESLGERYVEREFIENTSGTYRRNPSWLVRHPVRPHFGYQNWFMKAICSIWQQRHATPGQLEALEVNKVVMGEALCEGELWSAKQLRRDWVTPEISWEEFQEL